jgi:hypothetical protein
MGCDLEGVSFDRRLELAACNFSGNELFVLLLLLLLLLLRVLKKSQVPFILQDVQC